MKTELTPEVLWSPSTYDDMDVGDALLALAKEYGPTPHSQIHAWNKWEARSGLQKCIRRGLEGPAIACALRLAQLDFPYLIFALNTVTAEDICVGDPNVVFWVRQIMSDKRAAFRSITPNEGIAAIVVRMCRSVKNRLACDMTCGLHAGVNPELKASEDWGRDYLLEAGLGVHGWKDACLASYHITNKLPEGIVRNDHAAALKPILLEFVASWDLPQSMKRAALIHTEKSVGGMHSAILPAALEVLRRSETMVLIDDAFPENVELQGLPSSTWDQHVSTGKIAIKAFYTNLAKRHGIIHALPAAMATKVLGLAVFLEEGGMLANRLSSPWIEELRLWPDEAICIAEYKLPTGMFEPICQLVRSEIKTLNQKRAWVQQIFSD